MPQQRLPNRQPFQQAIVIVQFKMASKTFLTFFDRRFCVYIGKTVFSITESVVYQFLNIFSVADLHENNFWIHRIDHTLNALLHYLVKCECSKLPSQQWRSRELATARKYVVLSIQCVDFVIG